MKKFGSKPAAPRGARSERPPRKSYRRDDEPAARRAPPRSRDDSAPRGRPPGPARYGEGRPPREAYGDPYQRVARPPRGDEGERRGFTVTLDPDVARVFRGDASVNKALRLVIQLMEVAAPRPRGGERAFAERPRRPGGYQGSGEARGFVRKPRFDEDEG